MTKVSLPPGFRFHPTDVELIMYYLKRKITGKKLQFEAISELNIYKFLPWDLKDKSCLRNRDLEVFFFCPREKKYASGARTNRSTPGGYWKTTGKDRTVFYDEITVGMVKTLVFHLGQAPQGERTDWVMHEYRFIDKNLADTGVVQDAYVLCKVFKKSGRGPQNGAQYGAPFNEDDYDDEGIFCAESASTVDDVMASHFVSLPNNPNVSSSNMNAEGPSSPGGPALTEVSPVNEVDMDSLLALFTVDGSTPSLPVEFDDTQDLEAITPEENVTGVNSSNGNNIYDGLGDLGGNLVNSRNGGLNIEEEGDYYNPQNPMIMGDYDTSFLELNDLNTPLTFASAETTGFSAAAARHLPGVSSSFAAPYNGHDDFGQIPFEDNFFGAADQNDSGLYQLPPLPESLGNHFSLPKIQEHGIGNQEELTRLRDDIMYYSPRRVEASSSSSQSQIRGRYHPYYMN